MPTFSDRQQQSTTTDMEINRVGHINGLELCKTLIKYLANCPDDRQSPLLASTVSFACELCSWLPSG